MLKRSSINASINSELFRLLNEIKVIQEDAMCKLMLERAYRKVCAPTVATHTRRLVGKLDKAVVLENA